MQTRKTMSDTSSRLHIPAGASPAAHWVVAALALLAFSGAAQADVKLPSLFTDHMVLQRALPVPVWGWAEPGEAVTVTIGSQKQSATADAKGQWRVKLEPLTTGEPLTLTVQGKNTLTVRDVLVGEVWLCSGQSNMAMTVARAKDFDTEKAAARYPQIRTFKVASAPAPQPQSECRGKWAVCSPETVATFSATAYFFSRALHQKLDVPVGLIDSSVGGTAIEAWTSLDAQQGVADLKPVFARWEKAAADYEPIQARARYEKQLAAWKEAAAKAKGEGKTPPRRPRAPVEPRLDRNHPANLFNGMIAPLVPYAIRGAIWYQGENNAQPGRADLYPVQLPLLIQDWRSRWGEGDFPFLWVQLPNFRKPTTDPGADSAWAVVREGMLLSLRVQNTGMAVTIDLGEANDIHPQNKQDVGARLALSALAQVYHQKVAGSGPLFRGHMIAKSEVTLTFRHTDSGLVARGGPELKGFAIAGPDGKWHWAKPRIEGDTVIVSHPDVKEPAAVRYDWADNPDGNLYNGAGLPASPFRTNPSVAEPLPIGPGKVEVETGGHSLEVFTYKPTRYQGGPLIVVFHGMLRNADTYRDHARALAERSGALVVAPLFDTRRFPNDAYQEGGLLRRGKLQAREQWTWSLVPQLVDTLRGREGRPELPYYLVGHSAGGQFLSRLAGFVPTGARRIVVANPGSHLFPSRAMRFPYGFGRLPDELGDEAALKRYLAQPVTVYLGTADTGSQNLPQGASAKEQGATRYERGKNCFRLARELAQALGWEFNWRLVEVPNIGHDGKAMLEHASCVEALFGKLP